MVTNNSYIILINKIASLFCKTDSICRSGVVSRLTNYLDNASFEIFLQGLSTGRWGVHSFKIIGWNLGVATIKLDWMDIVTGKQGSVNLTIPKNVLEGNQYWSYIENKLDPNAKIKARVVYNNKAFMLIQSPTHASYGISVTPSSVPGGTPGITPTPQNPPGGSPGGSPLVSGAPTIQAGGLEDILSFLSNPIVLAGVVLGGYFIWKGTK